MVKKILLVDDEIDFINIMKARITSWGYEVQMALNGKEAIEILKEKKPDVVILDYLMPDMDGVATLKEIRRIGKTIPVIMFTAHPDTNTIKGTEKLNVSAFIPKLSLYSDAHVSLKAALNMVEKRAWWKIV
jgi:DNA-binding NtrC family response regulator